MKHYDTIVIGAGIVGCAAARFLSKYQLDILVIEFQEDISCGASKANSGIVHAGYDCIPGTNQAKYNVLGTAMYPALAKELDIPLKLNGSLVLCFNEEDHPQLEELYQRGIANNVPDMHLISAGEAYKIEPNLAPGLHSALWAKTAGIVSPYEATIAFAENAAENGVEFLLNSPVTKITTDKKDGKFTVETPNGTFTASTIINAAGVESAKMNNFVSDTKEEILPQRGEYYLLDNAHKGFVNCVLFPLPGPKGKGILLAPTFDGNTVVGPNAEDIEDGFDTQTTRAGLDEVAQKANQSVANLPLHGRITTFTGIRAKIKHKDFILNEPVQGFFNAMGVDSPGLSAAPAIGEDLANKVAAKLNAKEDPAFNPRREGIKRFSELSFEEQAALIEKNPKYGHVICRCEMITEAEVVESINRKVGARSLDAIKRRSRAQMGRCQGGFCSPKLAEILARELKVSEESIWSY